MAEVNVNVVTCEDSCSSNKINLRRTKSDVSEFFIKQEKFALCKICNKEYAFHGGTSNLRDHLIRAHPSKSPLPQNQASLKSYLSHSKCSDSRATKITEHIVPTATK